MHQIGKFSWKSCQASPSQVPHLIYRNSQNSSRVNLPAMEPTISRSRDQVSFHFNESKFVEDGAAEVSQDKSSYCPRKYEIRQRSRAEPSYIE